MKLDCSDLTRKEARTILYIDTDFKYDDVEKGKKLLSTFQRKNLFITKSAKRFEHKFMEYCISGVVGASCPMCNSFLEGKGRLLCNPCISVVTAITTRPENENDRRVQSMIRPVATTKQSSRSQEIIAQARQRKAEYKEELKENIKENLQRVEIPFKDIVDKDKYVVFPKKPFYFTVAGAIVAALVINFLIAMPYIFMQNNNSQPDMATIQNQQVPTTGK